MLLPHEMHQFAIGSKEMDCLGFREDQLLRAQHLSIRKLLRTLSSI